MWLHSRTHTNRRESVVEPHITKGSRKPSRRNIPSLPWLPVFVFSIGFMEKWLVEVGYMLVGWDGIMKPLFWNGLGIAMPMGATGFIVGCCCCCAYVWLTIFWMNGLGPESISRSSLADEPCWLGGLLCASAWLLACDKFEFKSRPNKSCWLDGAGIFTCCCCCWPMPFEKLPNPPSPDVGLVSDDCFFKWFDLKF